MAAAVSLALVVSAVAGLAGCGKPAPAPPTAHVVRGTVSTKVSASGALAAVTSQGLAFPKAAQLDQLMVKVGDVVRPGQVLAREDDFAFMQALNQQRAALNQQQAALDRLVRTPLVSGDRRSVDAAQRILSATEANGRAIHARDENAVSRARQAVDLAVRQQGQAREALRSCRRGQAAQPADADDDDPMAAMTSGSGSGPLGGLTGSSTTTTTTTTPAPSSSAATAGVDPCAGAVSAKDSADSAVLTARTNFDAARKTEDVDDTNSRVAVETARQGVVTAQNALDSDRSDRRPNIDAQAALVANAAAGVALAQRDVDNAVLFAPVAGTVSAINGAVGEFMTAAGSGTTALAPGTDAGIPGVGAAATSDQSASNSSISATRPGGGAFIVMNNINTFQVVVPFEESDAAKVAPNQRVQVSFDAIPDLTRDGTVLSISPGGVNISGVTNYYATVLLTNSDPRLRSGQTAEAGVLVNEVDNVLVVPNSAIIKQGGRSFVNTPGPGGTPQQTEFQPGLVGDDTTQVLSGLREGQAIQLPQATVSPSTGGGGGPGGGGGGGRGGG
jgi:HlyD family secretion protein